MQRCFIALNLPSHIKAEFAKIQTDLKHKNKGIKITWVDPEIAHINLHFLGDLDENRANALKQNLKALEAKYGPISAILTGVGAFPSLKMPRILFLGVKHKGKNNLIKLYQNLGKILNDQGLKVEGRPFIAHITLGRVRNNSKNIKFTGEEMLASHRLDTSRSGPDIEFKVSSFELMESVLTPNGPEYKTIKSYEL